MEVRRARPEELGICAGLYVRVLRDTFTWVAKDKHKEADFLRAAREEEVYVAVEDGIILGLAAFYRPQNFIHSLYAQVRGQGVGKALLGHLISIADGPLTLKVQEPNLRAQKFYAREGFDRRELGYDQDSHVAWLRLVRMPWK